MKKISIYILSIFLLITSLSCKEDFDLDRNTDPLAATTADPNAILPFVFAQYSNRKITEIGTRISDVPQIITACFNSPRNGVTTSFLTGNTWNMYYTQVLGNLTLVEADALAAGPTSYNVAAIAKIMSALAYYELTSIWESVPFTEAQNGQEFPQPLFDDQELILNGVVTMLDEAMELIATRETDGRFDVSVGDLIYGGDMALWNRFANSLKLRVLMMLRNGGASVDGQIATTLSGDLITETSQNAYLAYETGPSTMNAYQNLIEAFFGGTNESSQVHGVGEPVFDILNDNADPRFDMIVRDFGDGPVSVGVFPGATDAVYSNNVIRRDLPDMWYLASETHLYLAELALEGVATGGTAESHYQTGVTRSLEWWGGAIPGATETIPAGDITGFAAGLGTPTLEDVYDQQYVDAIFRPILAWNHVRRNQWPVLDLPPGTNISTILKRFTYPPAENGANENTPANVATDVPMWFENL